MEKKRMRTGKRDEPYGKLRAVKALVSAHNTRVVPRSLGMNSTSVFQRQAGKERKFIDTNTGGLIVAAATVGSLSAGLNLLAQGTTGSTHVGNQVTLRSLYWMFQGSFAATTAGRSPIRLVIVYDKESNGAAPTIAGGVSTDIFSNDAITAAMNLFNKDRFIVLVDEIIEDFSSSGASSFMRKGYRKMSLPMVFNATTTATINAVQTGGVFAVCWQNGNIITAAPTHNLFTRFRFEDA